MLNLIFSKTMALAHQKDLLREAERQRLLALLSRHSRSRQPAEKLVLWLKQLGRPQNEFNCVPLLSTKPSLHRTDS